MWWMSLLGDEISEFQVSSKISPYWQRYGQNAFFCFGMEKERLVRKIGLIA